MEIEVTIKNYRCFPNDRPAKITLNDGFTALVGVNNSGKSSLLRFFYEFRPIFHLVASNLSALLAAIHLQSQSLGSLPSISDANEVFNNRNDQDISIGVKIVDGAEIEGSGPMAREIWFEVNRRRKQWDVEMPALYQRSQAQGLAVDGADTLRDSGRVLGNLRLLRTACGLLADTLYVGPFRNAVNMGGNQDYYDIKVGQHFISSWRKLKTGPNIGENEAVLELTENIRKIFGFDNLEIDASQDEQSLKTFVNNKSFRHAELGSGLTQFIMVLANAAVRRHTYSSMSLNSISTPRSRLIS